MFGRRFPLHRQAKPWRLLTKAAGIVGISFLFCVLATAAPAVTQESDSAACLECHDGMTATFKMEPHAALDNCAACHTGAEKHMEEGGGVDNILAFRDSDGLKDKAGACLGCHTRDAGRYMASPHGKASMDCTTCHSVHATKPALLKTSANKNCRACHEDVSALFKLNERHRLQEGILWSAPAATIPTSPPSVPGRRQAGVLPQVPHGQGRPLPPRAPGRPDRRLQPATKCTAHPTATCSSSNPFPTSASAATPQPSLSTNASTP